jgi:hypothetical protein
MMKPTAARIHLSSNVDHYAAETVCIHFARLDPGWCRHTGRAEPVRCRRTLREKLTMPFTKLLLG